MVATTAFHAQQPTGDAADATGAGQPTFRAGVELVSVSVTVTDERGRLVTDLTEDDFIVFEDGRQQRIANFRSLTDPDSVPIGLGLVVDASSSMSSEKLGSVRIAVATLLERALDRNDAVYMIRFAEESNLVVPWTTDRDEILKAVRRVEATGGSGGTAIYDAIGAALPISTAGTAQKQIVLVITDGGEGRSAVSPTDLAKLAWQSEVLIYALVVDGEEARWTRGPTSSTSVRRGALELNQITAPTGGQTYYVEGFQQLEDRIRRLGDEFTQQYFLEYARDGKADGRLHDIAVHVRRPDLLVRHRRSYLAD